MNGKWRQTKGERTHETARYICEHGIVDDGILDVYRVCCSFCSFCSFFVFWIFSFFPKSLLSLSLAHSPSLFRFLALNFVHSPNTYTHNVHTTFSKCCGHRKTPSKNKKISHTKWNGCVIVIISLAVPREDTIKWTLRTLTLCLFVCECTRITHFFVVALGILIHTLYSIFSSLACAWIDLNSIFLSHGNL